jgi:hypothetical protein
VIKGYVKENSNEKDAKRYLKKLGINEKIKMKEFKEK